MRTSPRLTASKRRSPTPKAPRDTTAEQAAKRLRKALRKLSQDAGLLVPSAEENYSGDGSYLAIGEEFLRLFVEVGGLRPGDAVLEIGSGLGRMALPLTAYLNRNGRYTGIEIVEAGVEWCESHVAPLHRGFSFRKLDLSHPLYNPTGALDTATVVLDDSDASYDFVLLTSVFTHLDRHEVGRYLDEIARVLREGGRCFATFFLIDEAARRALAVDQADHRYPFDVSGHGPDYLIPGDDRKGAVAFDASWVLQRAAAVGLVPDSRLRRGSWTGGNGLSFQDIVVWRKAEVVAGRSRALLALAEPKAAAVLDDAASVPHDRMSRAVWRAVVAPCSYSARLAAAEELAARAQWDRLDVLVGDETPPEPKVLVRLIDAALRAPDPKGGANWLRGWFDALIADGEAGEKEADRWLSELPDGTDIRSILVTVLPAHSRTTKRLAAIARHMASTSFARFLAYLAIGAGNPGAGGAASPPGLQHPGQPARDAQEWLLLRPEDSGRYNQLVRALFGTDPDGALRWLDRQLRMEPANVKARVRKASIGLLLGAAEESRLEARIATCLDPRRAVSLEALLETFSKDAAESEGPQSCWTWLAVLAPHSRLFPRRIVPSKPQPSRALERVGDMEPRNVNDIEATANATGSEIAQSASFIKETGPIKPEPSDPTIVIAAIAERRKREDVERIIKEHGYQLELGEWSERASETLHYFGYQKFAKLPGRMAALAFTGELIAPFRRTEEALGTPITPALQAAITEIEVLLGHRPREHLVRVARALLADRISGANRKAVAKARRLLESVLEDSPGNYDAIFALHELLIREGKTEEAYTAVQRAIDSILAPLKGATPPMKTLVRVKRLEALQRRPPAPADNYDGSAVNADSESGATTHAGTTGNAPNNTSTSEFDRRLREAHDHVMHHRRDEAFDTMVAALNVENLMPDRVAQAIELMVNILGIDKALSVLLRPERDYLAVPPLRRLASRLLMAAGRFDEAAEINRADGLRFPTDNDFSAAMTELLGLGTKAIKPQISILGHADMVKGLGDFVMQITWLASLKRHFTNALLTVVTPPLRDATRRVIDFCPEIDRHVVATDDELDDRLAEESANADYIFTHKQILHLDLQLLEHIAHLVIPEALRAGLAERLTSLGVSRKRWVVGIHTRHNSSYRDYHPINYVRDVDTTQFVRLADYVIDELGGQVVWMGHPSMAVPTKRPGVIDLSAEPMDVQYYATAVSRYFVGCDSGPAMVSAAFKVPTLKSNSMYDSGAWNPGDIMLPKNILTADGRVVSQTWRWLRRHVHWLTPVARARDFVILDNTFEQLRFCVDILHGRTTEVTGWRPLRDEVPINNPPEAFLVRAPARNAPSRSLIDLSHLLGRPVLPVVRD